MGNFTILCVDDERNILLTLRAQLSRHFPDCAIEIAESGAEALEVVAEILASGGEVPLVIADQIMPGMKGDHLLIQLHGRHPQMVKVMLTGQAQAQNVGNVVNRGHLYRFLAKPWSEADLILTATEALRRYQQDQQLAQQQLALEQASQDLATLNAALEQQVTDRTQDLESALDFNQQVIATAQEGIVVYDQNLRYRVWNRFMEDLSGLTAAEVLDQYCLDRFPFLRENGVFALLERALAGETVSAPDAFFNMPPMGKSGWTSARFTPLRDAQGRVVGVLGTVHDITERKRMELALQESEIHNRALLSAIPDIMAVVNAEGQYLSYAHNQFGGELLPLSDRDLVGRHITEVLPQAAANHWLAAVERVLTTGEMQIYEQQIPFGGGDRPARIQYEEVRMVPYQHDRVLCLVRDVSATQALETVRQQAEATLQKSTASLAEAQRVAQVGNWEFDLTTQTVTWSEELFRLYGRDAAQGQPTYDEFRQQIPAEDWLPFERAIERTIAEGLPYAIEHRVIRPDGAMRYALSKGLAQVNDQGQTIWLFGTTQDITAAKQAQEALRVSEHRYATLAEAISVGLFRFDAAGDCIYVNQSWCAMTGRPAEAAFGQNWIESLHPDDRDRLLADWAKVFEHGEFYRGEGRYLQPNGHIVWFYGQVSPEIDAQGRVAGCVGTVTNISDRKRAETRLEAQNALLARIAQSEPLTDILKTLIQQVEQSLAGALCSVLWLDSDSRLRHGAAPSLPPAYVEAVDGVQIGEGIGSCGTAAHRNETITATDIATDPLWQNFRELALSYGLQACWSMPFTAADGQVLGTFGVYYREPKSPQLYELDLIAQVANIAGIAIERDRAEAKIRQSAEQLRLTLEFTGIGAWNWQPDTGAYDWNGKMEDLLEIPTGLDSMFQVWCDRIHPEDVDRVQATIQQALDTQTAFAEDYRYYLLDGRLVWREVNGQGVYTAAGDLEQVLGTVQDIDQRKQAEAALRASEQKNRAMLMAMPDLLLRVKPDGTCLDFIPPATPPAIDFLPIHRHISEVLPPELLEPELRQMQQTREVGELQVWEHTILRQGVECAEEVRVVPCGDDELMMIVRDISERVQLEAERKQIEVALQESEEQLRLALEFGHIAIWDWDLVTGKLRWNDISYEILGYSPGAIEPSYDAWLQAIHPDDREVTLQEVELALAEHRDFSTEYRVIWPDGTQRWLSDGGRGIYTADGQGVRAVGIMLDITDRKQAELALAIAEAEQRSVLENIPSFVTKVDQAGTMLFLNRVAPGFTMAEVVGRRLDEFTDPSSREVQRSAIAQVFDTGEPVAIETLGTGANGAPAYYDQRIAPVYQNGQIEAAILVSTDISDRKQAELALQKLNEELERRVEERTETLQQSEIRYRAIVEDQTELICRYLPDGTLTFVNTAYCRYFNQSSSELLGNSFLPLFSPADQEQFRQKIAQLTVENPTITCKHKIILPDGSLRWQQWTDRAIFDPQQQLIEYQAVGHDITERARLEAEQQKLMALIETSHDFIGVASMEGQPLYRNAAARRLVGLDTAESPKSVHMTDFFFPADLEIFQQEILPTVMTQGSWQGEFRFRHFQTGEPIAVDYTLFIVKDPATQQPLGLATVTRDIRDRKQAELALRDSEERFRATFEQAAVGMIQANLDGQFVRVNQKFCDIVGYSEAELFLKHFGDITHPDDLAKDQALASQLIAGDLSTFELEKRYLRSDGSIVWANLSVSLVRNSAGEAQYYIGIVEDITDRKQAELELQKLAAIVENSTDLIGLATMTGESLYLNAAGQTLMGVTSSALVGMPVEAFLSPEGLMRFQQEALPNLIQQGYWRGESMFRHVQTGETIVTDQTLFLINDSQTGEPICMATICRDIRDRKRAEAQLREQEQFLRSIYEGVNQPIFVADVLADHQVRQTGWNPATARLIGKTTEEVAGQPIHNHFAADEAAEILRRYGQCIATHQPLTVEECLTFQGQIRWMLTTYNPLIDSDGRVHRVVGTVYDITERKQSELDLQESRNMLQLVLDAIPQRVFWKDHESRFLGCNPAFANDYHLTHEQIVGKTDLELPWAEWAELYRADDARVIETQIPKLNYEELTNNLDGEPIWIRSSKIPLTNIQGDVIGVLGCYENISDRKLLEQELRQINSSLEQRVASRTRDLQQAMEAAQAASRAKSTFLSNMSHELRTPLNAILGFSQLLGRNEVLAVDEQHQINIINRSGQHLLTLINDILEMSKIEAGRATLSLSKFDLQQLLHHLEELFHLKAQSKGLTLTIPWEAQLPRYIQTDEAKLRQVLTNLLGNAIKFTQVGRVTLRVQVDPTPPRLVAPDALAPDGLGAPSATVHLQFSVQDTGPGIDPSEQEFLFKPFIQTRAGQASQEGTGLGLPISQQFVHLMGGDLQVLSRLGEGATFFFEIPVVPVAVSDLPPQPLDRKVVGLAPNQPQYRILVVEDHWENRQFLVKLLRSIGLLVQEAENGQAAVRLWQQWTPHLIWMDMRMPVMDGYGATRQIRALEATQSPILHPTKIVALTASAFDNEREAILATGCDDLICKPATAALLFDKMAEHLGVSYLYQAPKDTPAPSALPSYATEAALAPLIAALQTMPPTWIEQLHQAARMADEDLVTQCLEQIPPGQSMLLAALQAWVDDLRLDKLVALTTAAQASEADA